MDSLQKAKNDLRQGWETPDGATCSCCGQKVKKYHRRLTSSMSVGLIRLSRLGGFSNYHHVSELKISGTGGKFAQLKRWGLIEEQENDDTKKRKSGWWRITTNGLKFINNEIRVPAYCDTYNMKTLGFSSK
ncbi:MAG: hypothetical protein V3S33_02275, partial [Gammaproteobacteria bacterium]